jgi:two-component system NtrC family sensor kinase
VSGHRRNAALEAIDPNRAAPRLVARTLLESMPGADQMLLSKDPDKPLARRFRVHLAAAVLTTIALGPLILTGVVNLSQFRSAYRAKVTDHLEALILQHAHVIDSFLANRLSDIRVLAREHGSEQLTDEAFLRRQLSLLREEYHGAFVDLGVVDQQGLQVAYAGPFNLHLAEYASAEWFQAALEREHFISDVFAGLRGTPHFIVTATRREAGSVFIVKATIDFEAFNALVERLRLGRTGFAFIVNRGGEFQTEPRFEVALQRAPYSGLLEGRMGTEQVVTVDGKDALGRPSLFTFAPLKQGEWSLCYQQQAADAMSDLRQVQTVALAVFVMAVVLTILVSYQISRQLAVRLAQADQRRQIMSEKVIETGRLASIGELAAGIAHEINNPVAIMVQEAGWIDDLLSHEDLREADTRLEIERAVRQICSQGDRCKDITYKLLSFARKTDPTVRKVDISAVVEEVLGLMSQKTRYANVRVESSLASGLPPVSASPSELQQVLLNLVNNAVDAIGPGGGTVTIRTRLEGAELVIEVEDTGSGIAPANLPRIFDPFFTTKPVGQGTGLGLSICYGIVDKMGGRIEVDSELEKGTTFTVHLPCVATGDGAADRPPQGPAPGASP